MNTVCFESFGETQSGRVVTHWGDDVVVYARNPYGTRNLVIVDWETEEAITHGNIAVAEAAANWMPKRSYRKVRKFLAARGVGLNWSTQL